MAKDPLSQISNVNAGLDQTIKKVTTLESLSRKLGGIATGALGQVTRLLMPSVGMSPGMGLGTANAQFSNGAGGSQGGMMPWLYTKKGAAAVGGVQFGLGVAGGMYDAVPDLGTTISRASGFYTASLRSAGAMNRAGLARATFGALGGGITGPGEDAAASAMLVQGYNYMPGSADFTRAMQEVGGAARYLNMPNATAAQAIGGLHTGAMGGNLYQYGISTFDPKTGRARSTGDIARQLFDRMTQGRQVTAEQMSLSLREGFAGQSLRALGFSQSQQEIFGTMLTNMAAGKRDIDLENAPFNPDNPNNAQMKIATSMTSLMERGTEPMIAGFNNAATAAAALNAQLERLPDGFFKAKGFVQGFSNTPGGSLVSGVAGGIAAGVSTVAIAAGARKAMAAMAAKSATSFLSPAVLNAMKAGGASSVASTAGKVGLSTLGKTMPILGGAVSGFGSGGTGSFLASVGTSAAIGGAFAGPIGAASAAGLTALGFVGAKAIKSMFGTPANASQASQTGTAMTAGMDPGLVQTLQNAGFSGASLNTAYGIVKAESGGRADAYNPTGLDKSYGLFQINMENNDPRNPNMGVKRNEAYLKKYKSIGYTGPESLKDPNINAKIAYDISKGGTNFNPWTTYTSGKYLQNTSGVSTANVGTNTVNVNVNLANASIAEANSLAKKIKEILLKDKDLQAMGSK
jgi:hypothetical protein